jgi:hypothetical protein
MKPTLRLLVAVCSLGSLGSLGLVAGCDDDDGGKAPVDAGDAGGTGGARPDGGDAGGTGGTTGTGDAGPDALDVPAEMGGGDGGGDVAGAMASALITAAEGGSLSAGGGTLTVPAGALAADTMIELRVLAPGNDPWTANIYGQIYDFEPSGLEFQVPAALSLPVGTVPANKDAVVAWLDDASAQWFPVPSTVDKGMVTGLVSHFTGFAVLLLDKTVACPFSGACGGSIDGTWEYDQACTRPQQPQSIPCGNATPILLQTSVGVGGTITVAQGRYTSNQTVTVKATAFFTPACLAAVNQATVVYADCAAVQAALRQDQAAEWVCGGTLAQGCSCTVDTVNESSEMGTAVVTGQQVTFTEDGAGTPGSPADFCAQTETLVLRDADGSVYTAMRK